MSNHHQKMTRKRMLATLRSMQDYTDGQRLLHARHYKEGARLLVQIEKYNVSGSIKIRPAFSIISDLIARDLISPDTTLVESTSGNLGIAVACITAPLNISFKSLVDPVPFMPEEKRLYMESLGIDMITVEKGGHIDHRSARIALAKELDKQEGTIWLNQYENPANHDAHFKYTGPDVLKNANRPIDFFIGSVGTGGTITGVARYLKAHCPGVRVIATEPKGSTIFGGEQKDYLSVGAGLCKPTPILLEHWYLIDYFCQVEDAASIKECTAFHHAEGESVGITTGSCLVVAKILAERYPGCTILTISPDGGEKYEKILNHYNSNPHLMECTMPTICKTIPPDRHQAYTDMTQERRKHYADCD